MNLSRSTFVKQLLAQREALLQACWAHQMWSRRPLRTTDGQELQVLFPGWLNRGPGPDFVNACILLGDTQVQGDIEVHLRERDWQRHGHEDDSRYGRVMLHVVLERDREPLATSHRGGPIPLFAAGPFVSPHLLELEGDASALLHRYETLPGRCGLRAVQAPPEALAAVVAHAAEVRVRAKAEQLREHWEARQEEQLLYELMLQSLGYRPYAQVFRALARRFPLDQVAEWMSLPYSEARATTLSRWFGTLGLLEAPAAADEWQDAGTERAQWLALWQATGGVGHPGVLKRGGSRPWNSPERRLVGMFHYLYQHRRGWLKDWMAFFHQVDALRDQPDFRRRALAALDEAFATPDWEPWRSRVSFGAAPLRQAARLIGTDRIAILVANAIVPFFLAYARQRGDAELEKVLYRLFIVLPGEGPNEKTRFMERRLMPLVPLPRTLRTQQGLIQIRQDFCTRFFEGCSDCRLPDLIALPRPAQTPT